MMNNKKEYTNFLILTYRYTYKSMQTIIIPNYLIPPICNYNNETLSENISTLI